MELGDIMKKIVLIDGNNLLFRSYYATAYSGGMMKNSKGFPTNALYGFTNMINKILKEEKPDYMLVALDKGKTFRHDNYVGYKAGRQEMPEELGIQIEYSKKLLYQYFILDNSIVIYESPQRLIRLLDLVLKEFGDMNVYLAKDISKMREESFFGKISEVKEKLMIREFDKNPHGEFVCILDK